MVLLAGACAGATPERTHEKPCSRICRSELDFCSEQARPWEGKEHCRAQHTYCVGYCYDVALFTPP